ncbi:MAG TPA: hypothetical protein PKE21_02020 [Flavobacteriales bacterium]|nr:hypothetical protein [Flavobacteriales bacterium]HMR26231.1 hypothetical protein [Flavobacteriales bacterium]
MSHTRNDGAGRTGEPGEELALFAAAVQAGRSDHAIFRHYTTGPPIDPHDARLDTDPAALTERLRSMAAADRRKPGTTGRPVPIAARRSDEEDLIEFLPRPFARTYVMRQAIPEPTVDDLPFLIGPQGGAGNTFLVFAPEIGAGHPFAFATSALPHAQFAGPGRRTVLLPRHTFDPRGVARDNISAWAVDRFQEVYGALPLRHGEGPQMIPPTLSEVRAARAQGIRRRPLRKATIDRTITSTDVIHYAYAAMHDPSWKGRPEADGAAPGPVRIMLHPDLEAWCSLGQELLDLHLGHDMIEGWPLTATPLPAPVYERLVHAEAGAPFIWRLRIKADREEGWIEVDGRVRLEGVPTRAWDLMLGERSLMDRVIDQFKEQAIHPGRSPKEERLARERHMDRFVRTLRRACRLSLETQRIRQAIGALPHAITNHLPA